MKKALKMLLVVIFIIHNTNVFAFNTEWGELIVDNTKIDVNSSVYFIDDNVWIPFRSVFESIGAHIEWNGNERKILIYYNNENYVALLDDYDCDSEYNKICVCKNKYEDCFLDGLFIQLSSFGSYGYYSMFNDMTYLDHYSMIRLMYYFGYYVDIDKEKKSVTIFPVTEKDYQYDDYPSVLSGEVDSEAETLLGSIFYIMDVNIINCNVQSINSDTLRIKIEFQCDDENEIFKWDEWRNTTQIEKNMIFSKINDTFISNKNNVKVYKNSENMETDYDLCLIQDDNCYIAYGEIPVNDL